MGFSEVHVFCSSNGKCPVTYSLEDILVGGTFAQSVIVLLDARSLGFRAWSEALLECSEDILWVRLRLPDINVDVGIYPVEYKGRYFAEAFMLPLMVPIVDS